MSVAEKTTIQVSLTINDEPQRLTIEPGEVIAVVGESGAGKEAVVDKKLFSSDFFFAEQARGDELF